MKLLSELRLQNIQTARRILRKFTLPTTASFICLASGILMSATAQTIPISPSGSLENPPVTSGELKNFDGFLDHHPVIDAELRKNPSLSQDPNYLAKRPGLQAFIAKHPGVQQQLQQQPDYFVQRGTHFQAHQPITRGELSQLNNFLDRHSVIDAEVRKDPALLHNAQYLESHPELHEFLVNHPGVDSQLESHPRYFTHREMGFQSAKGVTNGEVKNFDAFLDSHPNIDAELQRNPHLVDDPKYIETHPELHSYLNGHPQVDGAIQSHPGKFMHQGERYEKRDHKGKTHG